MKKIILGMLFALSSLTMTANNSINLSIVEDKIENLNCIEFIDADIQQIIFNQITIIQNSNVDNDLEKLPWCVRVALAVTGVMEDVGFDGDSQLAVFEYIESWC